ncbi:alpha/beta fold hydrolase [Streptomyces sp. NPDC051561]|uniref:alpha/beta fold hydrolase n=1 Tax=Streptomyces sp. NPDC051561 TaxID=3365658 RepID=UPI0037899F24
MTQFVLVAGAWLGSWVWDEVVTGLRSAGHGAHAVTLSGLADRRDAQGGASIGQQQHVRDIVGEIERLDLRDVVLVGHSYSGIPVGQAAERIGERLARLVFVDSNVPTDGQAFVRAAPDPRREPMVKALAENAGFWPPPPASDIADQDLSEEQLARFLAGATPHPGASLTEPAVLERPLGELPATYLKCLMDWPEPSEDVVELLTSERWELVEMNTGHWPMLSRPQELVEVLLAAAEKSERAG